MVKHKSKSKQTLDMPKAVMAMLKANVMAYVVTAIFILLGSIVLTYTNASAAVENWIVLIGIILSAFLAGFDTAKVDTRNGYKWGALGGVLYFILFLILGTMVKELKGLAPSVIFTIALTILISSTIAGMISVNYGK
ncbi:TIGR04086 family membrane protein [Cellulosilyticum sp. I15G10I2]|uniref:TIGR04086 family membrane protein n=1 Tax=Cellulosilyticum sp. I15G10I2 TaxID=1892843 RepID=UPI00085C500D|nr:TIGR04086 family membrane protein [Cellulosilyticum sp. I15G10I2]